MPIWDRLTRDPMSAMILMNSLQQLPQSMSKQNLAPRGGYVTGGYGQQQGGGMEDMLPQMLRMQQMQSQQANMQADNELQRKQFEFQQAAQQQQMQSDEQAAKVLGIDPSVVRLAREEFGKRYAERVGAHNVGANDRLFFGDQQVARALPEVTPSGFADREAQTYAQDPQMHADAMGRGQSGATRVSVSPTAIYGAQQGAFDKKIYEAAGESYVALQKDAEAARKMADDFRQINAVLGETPTGEGFDEWRLRFSKLANGIGIPVDEKAISSKETALSLVNQFALGARSPDGPLGGLPGSASNQDINFLKAIPPGIETTPEGRMLMADVQEAKAEHKSRKAQAARQYVQERGGQVDPIELDSFKAAYDKEHVMFGDVEKKWSGKFGQQSQQPGAADVPAHLQKYFAGP